MTGNLEQNSQRNPESGGGQHGNPWRIAVWAGAVILLLLPLVAMQVSDEVQWGPLDFAVAAILLFGTALGIELAVRKSGSGVYRLAAALALLGALLLIWINLAVGIIGDEGDAANLLYVGVLAVGIGGALLARFEAGGMARAMLLAAVAVSLVGVVALVAGWGATGPRWPLDVAGLTVFFAAVFGGSAWLFRQAAREKILGAGARPAGS
jgi:hypothetical protein